MKRLLLVILVVANSPLVAQTWLWGAQGNSLSDTRAISSDKNGNVFVGGIFNDTISFGSNQLTSVFNDSYLVKYDSLGNVLWAAQSKTHDRFSGAFTQYIATDNNGNTYGAGYCNIDSTVLFGADTLKKTTQAMFLVKYNPNGNVLWARQSVVPSQYSYSESFGLTLDNNGNSYVTGTFVDTASFGSITIISGKGGSAFLAKYDSGGNVLWVRQGNVPSAKSASYSFTAATNKSGDVFVCGYFKDSITFGSTLLKTNSTSACGFWVKYDSSGNLQWAKQAGVLSAGDVNYFNGIVADGPGNVYLTGSFMDTITLGSYTLKSNSSSGIYGDIFLAKYDVNGNVLWVKQSTHTSSANNGWGGFAVALDSLNNLYLSCGANGPGNGYVVYNKDTFQYKSAETDPALLLKLDTAGKLFCGSIINSGGDDWNNITVTPSGKYIYLGGDIFSNVTFGKDMLAVGQAIEPPFVARWQPSSSKCPQINVNITATTSVLCYGGSDGTATASATGGTAPYTYVWENQNTGTTATNLPIGSYVVTATDKNGCSGITVATITQPAYPLSVSYMSAFPLQCYGECIGNAAIGVTGGTSPYHYHWCCVSNPGGNFQVNLCAGMYSVVVTDTNGCTISDSIMVTQPPQLVVSIASDTTICKGQSVILTAHDTGGTPGYNLVWSTGGTNSQITVNPKVTTLYSVKVTDASYCPAVDTVTVTISSITVSGKGSINAGMNDTLIVTGANSYSWSFGSSKDTVIVSPAETTTYTVIGTSKYGCTDTTTFVVVVVNNTTSVTNIETGGSVKVYPNPFTNSTSIVFPTQGRHYVEVDDVTGRKIESIECNGTQYEFSRNGLAAGVYFIRTSDERQQYAITTKIIVE